MATINMELVDEWGKGKEVKIPTLVLTDSSGYRGYLQPFRGYRFQVSGSNDGDGDYGSSSVIGLKRCLDAALIEGGRPGYQSNGDVAEELLLGQAVLAIMQWVSDIGEIPTDAHCRFYPCMVNEKTVMGKFIDQCIEWLQSL